MLRAYAQAICAQRRKRKLERALEEYPLYDPPHKVEERKLSREAADENFNYFMRVRQQRVTYFIVWLERQFGVIVALDKKGIETLSCWGNKYAGFLLMKGPDGHPTDSYFTYEPPWRGGNTGHNVLFDMGIVLGEAIIANCPKLRWDVDPISPILPRTAKILKKESGTSFQRPVLTGFDNPAYEINPLHDVYIFSDQMMRNATTFDGIIKFYRRHYERRRLVRGQLINLFNQAVKDYPRGDPQKFLEQMSRDEYLTNVDAESNNDRGDADE